MNDFFYEESAVTKNKQSEKNKYKLYSILQIFCLSLAIIWLIVVYSSFDFGGNVVALLITLFAPTIILVALFFAINKLKKRVCVDFDYTIVSDSIRFSRVINDLKRIHLYSFSAQNISVIGNFNSNNYLKHINTPNVKVEYITSNVSPEENKHFYYLKVNDPNLNGKILVIECTPTFIKYLSKVVKKTVFEEGFIL